MVLRRIIIDNSAKFFPKNEQTRYKDSKPNTIKKNSTPRKQNKNVSQKIKKFIKNISAQGFKHRK